MKTSQHKRDEREIRELIDAWSRAVEAKDAAALVAGYTPETVLYDAIPPHRSVGAQAVRAFWEQCLPHFPEKVRSEHKGLVVEVDGDIAFVYGMHHFVPEPADHPCGSTWMRVTACYRRMAGKWRIVHEHVSVPFDPISGKAAYIADPDNPAATWPTETSCASASSHELGRVTPHLVCAGAAGAIDFYKKAFGATEMIRLAGPDGRLMHACLNINGAAVMLADEFPEMCNAAPTSLKGTPVTIHLVVDDVDAFAARAVEAGAKVVMPVADMFWGDRYGVLDDPYGHRWSVATPKRRMSETELKEAARVAMQQGCGPQAA
jgi:uncharacterized protein (TIGR02246 family)